MNNLLRQWRWIVLVAGLLSIAVVCLWWLMAAPPKNHHAAMPALQNPAEFLAGEPATGFAGVTRNYRLQFPRDHGAHPAFRQEWWYFTGNLVDPGGREYGYQLTFFRFAHGADDGLEQGGWNNDQTWTSHFALTDITANELVAEQDFARGGLGLANATSSPFSVWLNGWSGHSRETDCDDCFALELLAEGDRHGIQLQLETEYAPVLHGDNGFSSKSRDESVASYYYSWPDLKTTGSLQIDGQAFEVNGVSWMDHEWSTAVLAKGQSGWDWFALHFDDGRKMMLYQVRQTDGNPVRYAVVIDRLESDQPKRLKGVKFNVTDYWVSPHTGNRYPIAWKIVGPGVQIAVKSAVADQELRLMFTYYEGAMRFSGTFDGKPVSGKGYMELTGYGE